MLILLLFLLGDESVAAHRLDLAVNRTAARRLDAEGN